MNFAALTFAHPEAPLEIRESLQKKSEAIKNVFLNAPPAPGWVLLATCHRFEIYLSGVDSDFSPQKIRTLLAHTASLDSATLSASSRCRIGSEAAAHLFRVASGLESAVLGENEILGQVRDALDEGVKHKTFDRPLHELFQAALRTGKKVRRETSLGQGTTSLVSAAVREIETFFSGQKHGEIRVLLMGSGETAEQAGWLLQERGFRHFQVASRSKSHAGSLAKKIGGTGHSLESLQKLLPKTDLILSALADAPGILKKSLFEFPIKSSAQVLLLIDLALPRNAEIGLRDLPGLHLIDLEELTQKTLQARKLRQSEMAPAESIVRDELGRFNSHWLLKKLPPERRKARSLLERSALEEEEGAFEKASIAQPLSGFSGPPA